MEASFVQWSEQMFINISIPGGLRFNSRKRQIMQNIRKKAYKRCSAWRKVYRQEWISKDESGAAIRRNPYKIGRIVDRSIDFVTFFS